MIRLRVVKLWVVICGMSLLYTTYASLINPPPEPSIKAKMVDVVLGRPVMLFLTVAGFGIFIATLPFSAIENQVGANAQGLIIVPAQATFSRCLGCPVNFGTKNIHPFYSKYLPYDSF